MLTVQNAYSAPNSTNLTLVNWWSSGPYIPRRHKVLPGGMNFYLNSTILQYKGLEGREVQIRICKYEYVLYKYEFISGSTKSTNLYLGVQIRPHR